MQGHDDWLRRIFNGFEERQQCKAGPLAGHDFSELVDICSCDESGACADNYDSLDRVVGAGVVNRRFDAFGNARRQRVHRWIIDSDDGNLIRGGIADEFGHRVL